MPQRKCFDSRASIRLNRGMKSTLAQWLLACAVLSSSGTAALSAGVPKEVQLWPGTAPGERGNIGEEKVTTKPTDQLIAGKPVIPLGNVSKPMITIYSPRRTGIPAPHEGFGHLLAGSRCRVDAEVRLVGRKVTGMVGVVALRQLSPTKVGLEIFQRPLFPISSFETLGCRFSGTGVAARPPPPVWICQTVHSAW